MSTSEQLPNKYIEIEVDGQVYAQLNPEWKAYSQIARYEFFLKRSNIPREYWELNFDSYPWKKSKKQVDKCIQYATDLTNARYDKVSLYLYGKNSVGKTTVMCSIGKEAIKAGLKVAFVLAGNLTNMLFKTRGFTTEEESRIEFKMLDDADVVLIDDAFDKRKSVLWESESKAMIIAYWDSYLRDAISHGKKIVFTSNLSIAEVGTYYGASFSELLERNCVPLEFLDTEVKSIRANRMERIFT